MFPAVVRLSLISGTVVATTKNLSGLGRSYTVTVTDNNTCTATSSTNITQPTVISTTVTPTNIICFGGATGAVTLAVSGGTPSYTFLWSNGATTQNITGLIAGAYAVTVTDNHSCTKISSVTLTQPAQVAASLVPTNITTCFGATTGAVTNTPSGGTLLILIWWNTGATTQNINSKPGGTYTITVTDINSCTGTATATVTQPTPIVPNIVATSVTCVGCANGDISLTTTGGTPPYTYHWNTGAVFTQNLNNVAIGAIRLPLPIIIPAHRLHP